jgi:hypothetical protein
MPDVLKFEFKVILLINIYFDVFYNIMLQMLKYFITKLLVI